LTLLEKELDDVNVQLRVLRQSHTIQRRGTRRGLSDAQGQSLPNWNDLRDGCLSIEHRDCLASSDGAQILAQSGLQFCNSYLPHD
jgi:hypothetical protein